MSQKLWMIRTVLTDRPDRRNPLPPVELGKLARPLEAARPLAGESPPDSVIAEENTSRMDVTIEAIRAVTGHIPDSAFVLTSAHDDARAGAIAMSAQPVAEEPRLIAVALRRGHPIEPLIRDSRAFALCRVHADEKLLLHKFGDHTPPDEGGDPFASLPTRTLVTGSPILTKSIGALDCEVVRHLDLEADHELFVGLVRAAKMRQPVAGDGS